MSRIDFRMRVLVRAQLVPPRRSRVGRVPPMLLYFWIRSSRSTGT